MRRILLTISYDGTDFCGWQVQLGQRSVQGEIERALFRMHGHMVRLYGSGRTDSGVHASGQRAHFDSDIDSIPPDRFTRALNALLSQDVRILESREVSPDLDARCSALHRSYCYTVRLYEGALATQIRYSHLVDSFPSMTLLDGYASLLIGTHDFTTFTVVKDPSPSRVRHIHAASWQFEQGALTFRITGNAFLWKMVRSLVGTMLQMAREGRGVDEFRMALEAASRSYACTTAPAKGLSLERIVYESY